MYCESNDPIVNFGNTEHCFSSNPAIVIGKSKGTEFTSLVAVRNILRFSTSKNESHILMY